MWARILRWPKRRKRIGDAVMIHACARDATRDGRLYLSFSFVVVGRSHDDALHYDSDISSHTRSTLPVTTHTSPFSHSLLHLSSDFIIIIISSSSSAHTHTHTYTEKAVEEFFTSKWRPSLPPHPPFLRHAIAKHAASSTISEHLSRLSSPSAPPQPPPLTLPSRRNTTSISRLFAMASRIWPPLVRKWTRSCLRVRDEDASRRMCSSSGGGSVQA